MYLGELDEEFRNYPSIKPRVKSTLDQFKLKSSTLERFLERVVANVFVQEYKPDIATWDLELMN